MKPGGADWVRELNDDMAAIIEEGCQKTGSPEGFIRFRFGGYVALGDVWAAPLVSTYACLRGTRLMTIQLSFITVTIILLTAAGLVGTQEAKRRRNSATRGSGRAVAVGPPRRTSAHQFSACVKALFPGLIDGRMRPTNFACDHNSREDR